MNQYGKIFSDFADELIQRTPEKRFKFLNNLGFKIALENCISIGTKEEAIVK